jgi:uncharacterized linocin/CFP29 family protein
MNMHPARPEGLTDALIDRLCAAVSGGAREALTARRILAYEGPIGAGITAIEVAAPVRVQLVTEPAPAHALAQRTLPIPMLYSHFQVPVRDLLGARDQALPLNTAAAAAAGESLAAAEERLIYYGVKELGMEGLATSPGAAHLGLGDWSSPGQAIQDIVAAADKLDASRAHQPFSLVLAAPLYNKLFRKYEGSDVLQIDHLRRLASGGVYKALALASGGLLISPDVGPLVFAQDIETHYQSPGDASFLFEVSEALVLRLDNPGAVCVLDERRAP